MATAKRWRCSFSQASDLCADEQSLQSVHLAQRTWCQGRTEWCLGKCSKNSPAAIRGELIAKALLLSDAGESGLERSMNALIAHSHSALGARLLAQVGPAPAPWTWSTPCAQCHDHHMVCVKCIELQIAPCSWGLCCCWCQKTWWSVESEVWMGPR